MESKPFYKEYILWIIILIFMVAGGLSINDSLIYTPDSARYIAWATSLGDLNGFADRTVPEPARYVVHSPLYPILLSPIARIFPNNIVAMKMTTLGMGVLLLFVFGLLIDRTINRKIAFIGISFLAINPVMMIYSTQVLSDVAFGFVLIFTLFLLERITTEETHQRRDVWGLLLAVTFSVFLRDVGIIVLVCVIFFLMRKKEYRLAVIVIVIPLIIYLLWFVRNEIFIAGRENPPLRNLQLYISHIQTPQSVSIWEEFQSRISTNWSIYAKLVGKLLFFPEYGALTLPIVDRSAPLLKLMNVVLRYTALPLVITTFLLSLIGIISRIRGIKILRVQLLFVLLYIVPILLYPINDRRFLFPLLLLILYWTLLGGGWILKTIREKSRYIRYGILVLGLLLTIPNLVWTAHLVYTSRSYANSPQNFYEEFKNAKVKPWQYMKLFSQAGEWLMTHTEKKATIISRWKEIAFAAKGRKVAVIDAYATLEELERVIRDYNVPYIVSVVDYNGLNEFGFQMVVSKRFKFESVFRAGDVEIFQVKPKSVKDTFISPSTISDTTNYSLFKLAVYSLERSNYSKADSLLSLLWKRTDGGAPVVFYTALLREFQGKYEEANKLLQIFKSLPQAGALVEQAYFHQTIIERRIEAERETVDVLKATLYHFASMNYWELGFHQQAQEMLQRSINTKRDFFPAYVFGVFYALDEGDTLKAKKMFESLKRLSGTPAVASSFKKIFSWIDSMKSCNNQLERSRFHLQLGKEYLIIGLREMAIDQLLILLKENPNNQDGLKLLGDLYVEKRRYFPALRALDRLFALNPSNKEIALCIEALLERW